MHLGNVTLHCQVSRCYFVTLCAHKLLVTGNTDILLACLSHCGIKVEIGKVNLVLVHFHLRTVCTGEITPRDVAYEVG
jgi:hypothetical protein